MKCHFTSEGTLTIEAKVVTKDKENTKELVVTLEKTEDEQIQDRKTNGTDETINDVSKHQEQVHIQGHDNDTEEKDTKVIIEYPDDFELIEHKRLSFNSDLDVQGFPPDAERTGPNDEHETNDEILEESVEETSMTRGVDERRVIDSTVKNLKLSFNKEQFPGDDVKVLVKGNSLLAKSEKNESDDGLIRREYYATQYTLPDNVDVNNLSCSKNSEGDLCVSAPYKELKM
ncbi:uncharacterized protein [Argopecten irradians]|uniref:uncharacterized protein n=1 Tax=Argopecten irradians TaxID=31199 RepID=UPI00371D0E6D